MSFDLWGVEGKPGDISFSDGREEALESMAPFLSSSSFRSTGPPERALGTRTLFEMRNWHRFNQGVVEEFRANNGVVRGRGPLLLLTTTGARSGLPRITPLVYGRDGDDLVIVASKAGEPTNPDWYHNLRANPEVSVEVGSDCFGAVARVTEGEERERLFEMMNTVMYRFGRYQRKTTRIIPTIVLQRIP